MKTPGPSCHEEKITQQVRKLLTAAGIPASAITTDNAHKKSPAGGSTGNLIVKLPGTIRHAQKNAYGTPRHGSIMHWLQTNKAWRLNCLGKSKNCPWCRQSLRCCRHIERYSGNPKEKIPHPPLLFCSQFKRNSGYSAAVL